MLTGIGLRNFKAFGDEMQEAPLSKITLIYGPNSGGKSSIIQALLLLTQSLKNDYPNEERTLVTRGEFVDLGSFQAMLHKHDAMQELGISFSYRDLELRGGSAENRVFLGFRSGSLSKVGYRITLHSNKLELLDAVAKKSGSLWNVDAKALDTSVDRTMKFSEDFPPILDFWELTSEWVHANELERDLERESEVARSFSSPRDESQLQILIKEHRDAQTRARALTRELGKALELEGAPTKTQEGARDRARSLTRASQSAQMLVRALEPRRKQSQALARTWERARSLKIGELNLSEEQILDFNPENIPEDYEHYLRSINYLGPLRSAPQRLYQILSGSDSSQGITGIQGEYSANVLYHNTDIREQVNDCFNQFKVLYELDVIKWGEASLAGEYLTIALYPLDKDGIRIRNNKDEEVAVTLADVGYGINQILPVIIEGVASQEGSIICVEQPEIHLHPRLQANIADLMIDTIADEPGKRKQWIVETHSELLILRLQRHIREGKIKPEDISVLYVDPNDESTEGSAIIHLRMDEEGDFIDDWPGGFFEEDLNELI